MYVHLYLRMQHVYRHGSTLQHTATHCNTLYKLEEEEGEMSLRKRAELKNLH